jgi:Putative Ig domain/Proprotein convertase P-domain
MGGSPPIQYSSQECMGRSFRLSILAFILISFLNVSAQSNSASQKRDPLRALFNDPIRFRYLSSAAQMLLQRKFGDRTPRSVIATNSHLPDGAPTDVLVNDLSDDTSSQDTQSTAAITLASGSNVVVAFTDSGSFNGLNNHFSGYSTSSDSGTSFTDHGTLPDPGEGDSGSAVLARDNSSGTIYLATLGFLSGQMIPVFRSFDDGLSFNNPVNSTPGYMGSGDFLDKPWITVDNFSGIGQGNVYVVWRHFPFTGNGTIRFTRSTDGGTTWEPNLGTEIVQATTGSVQGPNVISGSNHNVHVFWYDQTTTTHQIKVRTSVDQGLSFNSAVVVTNLDGTGMNGDLALNGEFATNSFPQAAANSINGHLYVVYNDDPPGVDHSNIFLRRSTNSGATWDAAIQVNGDSTDNDQWHPAIAVTPDGSRLIVSWYDRRNDLGNSKIQRYGKIYSIDGSGNLNDAGEFLISASDFPVIIGQDPEVTPTYMGDYDQAAADNSFFYIPWGDNRDSSSAHANQPDVRFAKIPVDGPNSVLRFASAAVNDSNGNNNGAIDPNECIQLFVTLRNEGNTIATGISAVLSSITPGVIIIQSNSTYANIPPGATGANVQPFEMSTSPAFDCQGTDINFTLDVTTTDGSYQFEFVMPSGSNGTLMQFDSLTQTVIPDLGFVDIPIVVSGFSATLASVRASVQITHPNDSDLDLHLIGPDNTTVELSTDNGETGNDYGTDCATPTIFDDTASISITSPSASPPFTGSFRPEGTLDDLRRKTGSAVNGTWILRVGDDSGIDTGTVNCWSIYLYPIDCVPGNGGCLCPAIDLSPAALPGGKINQAYNQTITASGGTVPYTFAVTSGTLPAGITLDSSGVLSGTPTEAGTFDITITATDVNNCTGSIAYSLVIVDCLFCDDFEDGVLAADWTYEKLSWNESGGNLIGTPDTKKAKAIASPVFAGCLNCSVQATMTTSGGESNRLWLLAWYVDKKNTIELMMKEENDKWILKQRSAGSVVAKKKVSLPIDPNVSYTVVVVYNGTDFQVTIDGSLVITLTPAASVPSGTVGFQNRKTVALFDEIFVN